MIFYEIIYRSMPELLQTVKINKSCGSSNTTVVERGRDYIEISVNTKLNVHAYCNEGNFRYLAGQAGILMPDTKYNLFYEPVGDSYGVANICYLINLRISDSQIKIYNTENLNGYKPDRNSLLLPQVCPFDDAEMIIFSSLFHSLVINENSDMHIMAISKLFELLSMFDSYVRNTIDIQRDSTTINDKSGAIYYVVKAKRYIASNMTQKLTITEIASHLNITPNYLSSVFKKGTGKNLSEYINMMRMNRIHEMIVSGDKRNMVDICAEAGMRDIRNAQRMYKKYIGETMRETRLTEGFPEIIIHDGGNDDIT